MAKTISLAVILVLMASTGGAHSSKYQDTIPPVILEQYDPDVVSGERPKVVIITQPMIWTLRDQPELDGDVYQFGFDRRNVATVQKRILINWIKSGQKVVLWGARDLKKYAHLFEGLVIEDRRVDDPQKGMTEVTLTDHPVNTDVEDLNFLCTDSLPSREYYYRYVKEFRTRVELVASLPGGILAGRMFLGNGSVYFASIDDTLWEERGDKYRWELNFKQWMLGLPVPPAAAVELTPTIIVEQRDEILLKNGDILSGKLLTSSFMIKGFPDLSFDTEQIKSIVFGGASQNLDLIVLHDGDRFGGLVGPDNIVIQLEGGQEVSIERDRIKEMTIWQGLTRQ